jgi:ssDNA-binding Zn-finger/Zn-ribbon topoisomerase 1
LAHNGDVAQFDHLVIYDYGIVIIESKSVSTEVKINCNGEWSRNFYGKWQGMRSPVVQAKMQGEFLHKRLTEHTTELRGKKLGIQFTFKDLPIDVFVAISDKGVIDRETSDLVPNVCKADLVCGKIRDLIKQRDKEFNAIFSLKIPYVHNPRVTRKISDFLIKNHTPTQNNPAVNYSVESSSQQQLEIAEENANATPQEYSAAPEDCELSLSANEGTCPDCQAKMDILWGKFGYYWKCPTCSKNSPIKYNCPLCKTKMKIRKDKNDFYIYCAPCNLEALFHSQGTEAAIKEETVTPSASTCPKCQSEMIIRHGQYGYYWNCPQCRKNIAIKIECSKCKTKLTIRKDKQNFYIRCQACGNETLYHTNTR